MIEKFTHKNIDKEQYTSFLQQTKNYRIYAELWYLDVVCPSGYEIWVLNDFEAVMPIPYQKKLGFKWISQPPFCQQLGVFYREDISKSDFKSFFDELKKHRVRGYQFNEENSHYLTDLQMRTNQILFLNHSYENIYANFNSNRKRELSKNSYPFLTDENIDIESIEFLQKDNLDFFSHKNFMLFKKLMKTLQKQNKVGQVSLKDRQGKVLGVIVYILSQNRIISLLPLKTNNQDRKGIISLLYDYLIKKYANSEKILDFEGSMLSGVANFNRSLGAVSRQYAVYHNFKIIPFYTLVV